MVKKRRFIIPAVLVFIFLLVLSITYGIKMICGCPPPIYCNVGCHIKLNGYLWKPTVWLLGNDTFSGDIWSLSTISAFGLLEISLQIVYWFVLSISITFFSTKVFLIIKNKK